MPSTAIVNRLAWREPFTGGLMHALVQGKALGSDRATPEYQGTMEPDIKTQIEHIGRLPEDERGAALRALLQDPEVRRSIAESEAWGRLARMSGSTTDLRRELLSSLTAAGDLAPTRTRAEHRMRHIVQQANLLTEEETTQVLSRYRNYTSVWVEIARNETLTRQPQVLSMLRDQGGFDVLATLVVEESVGEDVRRESAEKIRDEHRERLVECLLSEPNHALKSWTLPEDFAEALSGGDEERRRRIYQIMDRLEGGRQDEEGGSRDRS